MNFLGLRLFPQLPTVWDEMASLFAMFAHWPFILVFQKFSNFYLFFSSFLLVNTGCYFSCQHGNPWENPKMCNILETADRKAKLMKIWDSSPRNSICRVLFISDFFLIRLRSFRALYNISDLKIFKRLLLPRFHPISTNLYGNYGN